jgi:hypothetical protein
MGSAQETTLLGSFSQSDDSFRSAAGKLLDPTTVDPECPPNSTEKNDLKDHETIPITDLFSREALPLYLPELDGWLGSLPPFHFTYPKVIDIGAAPKPFPPLDLLKGEKLKDLVQNSPPTPLWRDWNSIGSTVSMSLTFPGSL